MIIRTDPENWDLTNTLLVDSDAPTNDAAAREVDRWAHEHGFVRVGSYWLRRLRKPDGRRFFRGFCYRVTAEEVEGVRLDMESLDAGEAETAFKPNGDARA